METCEVFEEWLGSKKDYIGHITEHESQADAVKKLCWEAWEAGAVSLGECLKSLVQFIDKEIEDQYGARSTAEERKWMFEQLKARRENV